MVKNNMVSHHRYVMLLPIHYAVIVIYFSKLIAILRVNNITFYMLYFDVRIYWFNNII